MPRSGVRIPFLAPRFRECLLPLIRSLAARHNLNSVFSLAVQGRPHCWQIRLSRASLRKRVSSFWCRLLQVIALRLCRASEMRLEHVARMQRVRRLMQQLPPEFLRPDLSP